MAMEEALLTRLTGAAGIAALAGNRVSWFGRQRGDAVPLVVLSKISPGREWTHTGPDGLDRPRVQFDCYAADTAAAAALGRAVQAVMETAADVAGWRFHPAMIDRDEWIDLGEQDGGAPLFRVSQDYLFYHEEL